MFECCREIFRNAIKRPLNPYKPTIATADQSRKSSKIIIFIYIHTQKNYDANDFWVQYNRMVCE